MKQRPRIYYTESQKAIMWERWRKGESLQDIAQLFDRNHSSIQKILAETGGIQPAQRRRSRLALTLAEREEISGQRSGTSCKSSIPRSFGNSSLLRCRLSKLPKFARLLIQLRSRAQPIAESGVRAGHRVARRVHDEARPQVTRKFPNCQGSSRSTSSGNNHPRLASGVQSL